MANDNHQTLVILKQIKRFSPCDGIFNILPKGTVSQEQYVVYHMYKVLRLALTIVPVHGGLV